MKEQKSNNKKEKGITLIALIITIVVLLILASVSIGAIKDSKIITHAQDAKKTYTEAQIKEEIELFSVEYLIATNRNMTQDTKDKMIEICEKTGVKLEQLTVHYDLYTKEEIILYRIDKTTEEEQKILENVGIYPLRGDIDQDGYLTEKDLNVIISYVMMQYDDDFLNYYTELSLNDPKIEEGEEFDGYFWLYGDFDGDECCDGIDANYLDSVLRGEQSINEYLNYRRRLD